MCSREPSGVPAILQSNDFDSFGLVKVLAVFVSSTLGEQAHLYRYELRGRSVIGFVRLSLFVVTHIQVVRV